MKRLILAILLTGVAGFIGLMGGVLIAEAVSPFLVRPRTESLGVVVKTVPWYANLVMVALPTLGSMAGVIVGWYAILKMKDPDHEARHCGKCGYDLHRLRSEHCPECGTTIPTWQKRRLSNLEQNHA